jgi:hypothetical protein
VSRNIAVHFPAWIPRSLFCSAAACSLLYGYSQSPIDGHLGCFQQHPLVTFCQPQQPFFESVFIFWHKSLSCDYSCHYYLGFCAFSLLQGHQTMTSQIFL